MKRLIGLVVVTLLLTAIGNHAQDMNHALLLKGIMSLPTGEFAETDYYKNSGFAKSGFGASVEYESRFGTSPVKWFISSDIIINYFDEDLFGDMIYATTGLLPSIDNKPNINIPTMIGAKFTGELTSSIEFQIFGGFGLNVSLPPNYEMIITNIQNSGKGWSDNELATSFGYKIGGALFINKIILQVYYLDLGEPSYKGFFHFPSGARNNADFKQPISMMLFSVGVNVF